MFRGCILPAGKMESTWYFPFYLQLSVIYLCSSVGIRVIRVRQFSGKAEARDSGVPPNLSFRSKVNSLTHLQLSPDISRVDAPVS